MEYAVIVDGAGNVLSTVPVLAAQLPAALVGGRLDTNTGAWLGSAAPSVGQKAMAASLPVAIASDQPALKAREDTAGMTYASAATTASGAAAVIADTGALAAGDYDFDVTLGAAGVVVAGKCIILEHRDAANAATLKNLALVGADEALALTIRRMAIATNERIRAIVGAVAFAAAERSQASIGRRIA